MRHLAEAQQDGEAAAAALTNPKRRITLCVEGNISAGKSSFLQRILKGSVELRDIVEVRTHFNGGNISWLGLAFSWAASTAWYSSALVERDR